MYREVFGSSAVNNPELLRATCCRVDARDFDGFEKFGHAFVLRASEDASGICSLCVGKDLSGFPLDVDSADVDEIPLFGEGRMGD